MTSLSNQQIQAVLDEAVEIAQKNCEGKPASYIPELANVPLEHTGATITLNDGTLLASGDCDEYQFTLQSTAKVVLLVGLLEEFGQEQVFKWINVEPTGKSFNAIDYGNRFSPLPSNPMINAGAITLCSHIPGKDRQAQQEWLEGWMQTLFNAPLSINHKVYSSEIDTADSNRALAYGLRSNGNIKGDIDTILKVYTSLCSFEANIIQASYLPMLLANRGFAPDGTQVLNEDTVKCVVSIMATCGLYNETGIHLLRTGMPAKSGVSGLILATGIGHGGLAVFSPRLTPKGGSVRGHIMLKHIADQLGWHFALMQQNR